MTCRSSRIVGACIATSAPVAGDASHLASAQASAKDLTAFG